MNEDYAGTWYDFEVDNLGKMEDIDKWILSDSTYENHYMDFYSSKTEYEPVAKGTIEKKDDDTLIFTPTHLYATSEIIADSPELKGQSPGWFTEEQLLEFGFNAIYISEEYEAWEWDYSISGNEMTMVVPEDPDYPKTLATTEPDY